MKNLIWAIVTGVILAVLLLVVSGENKGDSAETEIVAQN